MHTKKGSIRRIAAFPDAIGQKVCSEIGCRASLRSGPIVARDRSLEGHNFEARLTINLLLTIYRSLTYMGEHHGGPTVLAKSQIVLIEVPCSGISNYAIRNAPTPLTNN